MNTRIIILGIVLLVYILCEVYIYFNLRVVIREAVRIKLWWGLYWSSIIAVVVVVASSFISLSSDLTEFQPRTPLSNFLIGFGFTLIVSKLLLAIIFLLGDATRLIAWLSDRTASAISKDAPKLSLEGRRSFIVKLGLGIAAIPFASFLYGITFGKYNYKVKKTTLTFPNLDPAFDGYKIVQISDIHSGSFDSVESVQRGVDLINEQKPDLVLFTGDLVNDRAEEIDNYIDTFRSIKSKDGVYSVTGNHDYGDYYQWPSIEAKKKNFENLIAKHAELNFNILQNKNVQICRGGKHFNLVGVDNWGLPPFPQKGDLDEAMKGVDGQFTVLMSHDPSHWDVEAKKFPNSIDLSLAGHTHGMQFGIDIPGFKWSPVKYKYPKWAGLYEENGKYLYVNRGFGFLGLPGRVGIWPEITFIELKSGQVS